MLNNLFYTFSKNCIVLYIVFPTNGKGGPFSLANYIKQAVLKINKYKTLSNNIKIIFLNHMSLKVVKDILSKKGTYIWFEKSYYINLLYNVSYKNIFSRIIYGPIVTPINWFNIPFKNSYEENWCLIMRRIYYYVVHSRRVKQHIIKYTKCKKYKYKYIILKPCIEFENITFNVYTYNQRFIDILIYIKYSDINRTKDEKILINYLKVNYTIKILKYGFHTKNQLLYLASLSKFIIYFSFYDTGALSLLEMKMMGSWPISHQKEFIEEGFGSYVKELDTNIIKSLKIIDSIIFKSFNPYKLSQNVIKNLNCRKSLMYVVNRINTINKFN